MIAGNLVAGIYSILPSAVVGWGATEPSYLGYVSHCSFAPWSTIISVAIAAVGIFLFVKLIKYFKKRNITIKDVLTYFVTTTVIVIAFTILFPFTICLIVIFAVYRIYKYPKLQMNDIPSNTTELKN